MVATAAKGIKRLKEFHVNGPLVHGTAVTQSGLSEWNFKIDFNDYGHVTGKYWLRSGNPDSSLPEVFAKRIQEKVRGFKT